MLFISSERIHQTCGRPINWLKSVQLFWWFGLFDVAVQRRTGDPKGRTNVLKRVTPISKQVLCKHHFPAGLQFARSAPGSSPRTCRSESRAGAFSDQVTLKFSHGSHHMKDQFTSWGRRIDLFGQTDKIHSTRFEDVQRLDEVFEGAAQAIY